MSFHYYMPTRILFGKGKLNELHKQLLPGSKAMVVISAGQSTKKNGYLARVLEQIDKAGVAHVVFDKILPNPIKEHVMEGAALAKEQKCDFVVGLGGGSSIDSAKSIAVMATNDGDYWDYVSGGTGKGKPVLNAPLPIVAITTTAGTGTEADPWTVITNGNEKIGFGYDRTFPFLSVVDPDLMLSVPADLTAYQGFDALFHSTEGYLNKTANEMSDLFSLKAISLISKSLAKAIADGNDENARADVALANTLSGIVETSSGCISEHSIVHALSAFYPKLPHGAALIIVSVAYYMFLFQSGSCDQRLIDMAKALGRKDSNHPIDFILALRALQRDCGVANLKLSDYGIQREELPAIAKNAMETMGGLYQVDPCTITLEDTVKILEESYR